MHNDENSNPDGVLVRGLRKVRHFTEGVIEYIKLAVERQPTILQDLSTANPYSPVLLCLCPSKADRKRARRMLVALSSEVPDAILLLSTPDSEQFEQLLLNFNQEELPVLAYYRQIGGFLEEQDRLPVARGLGVARIWVREILKRQKQNDQLPKQQLEEQSTSSLISLQRQEYQQCLKQIQRSSQQPQTQQPQPKQSQPLQLQQPQSKQQQQQPITKQGNWHIRVRTDKGVVSIQLEAESTLDQVHAQLGRGRLAHLYPLTDIGRGAVPASTCIQAGEQLILLQDQ